MLEVRSGFALVLACVKDRGPSREGRKKLLSESITALCVFVKS